MRIVFMGNPAIAVPALEKFCKSSHTVASVVSNPPKPMGRGRKLAQTAVAQRALELELPLLQPEFLEDPAFMAALTSLKPDVFIVVAFRILPPVLLTVPRLGAVNLHTSLLPAYRGAAPIQRALMNGEKITGITTFLIEPKVDRGDVLLQKRVPILPEDDYGSLAARMAMLGADVLLETVIQLEKGTITPQPQKGEGISWAPKIKPEEGRINWESPAEKIHNLIRALSPRPGAYTFFNRTRLKIFQSIVLNQDSDHPPGYIIREARHEIGIATGTGILKPMVVQPEGKRKMDLRDFLQGTSIQTGQFFR